MSENKIIRRLLSVKMNIVLAVYLLILTPVLCAQIPDRRPNGVQEDFGWFIAPTPIIMKGVGTAVPVFGLLSNVYQTTDLIAVKTIPGGDFDMSVAMIDDLPLFTRHINVTGGFFEQDVSFSLFDRGIDSDPDNYVVPFSYSVGNFFQANLLFWEDRIDLFYQQFVGETTTKKIFDKDGNLLSEPGTKSSFVGKNYGLILDFTDDSVDPRVGIQLGQKFRPSLATEDFISDVMVSESDIKGYIPLFGKDTLVLNLHTARSSITRSGVIDEASARVINNHYCIEGTISYSACKGAEDKAVADFLAHNKYGSTNLGGANRLRAYAMGRFTAGNSMYQAIEYRYNFSSDEKKINWFILGGVKTLLQLAFFYEQGTVAEETTDLYSNMKSSYGAGFRALISGFIYRFDLAMGDEGLGVTLFIDYPMQLNPITG